MKRTIHLLTGSAVVVAVLLAVVLLPASAGGPLANCLSGQPFLWPNGGANIPFNPDQGDLGPLTNAQAVAAVQAAFDVWGAVPSATVSYNNAGLLPVDVDITNFGPYLNAPAPDGLSAIVFDDTGEIFDLLFGPGSGILGFAGPEWGYIPDCTIQEGLSFLNGPAFTDLQYASDVMVHEFGHYTNLAHTVVNGQLYLAGDNSGPTPFDTFGAPPPIADDVLETMYPFYFGPNSGTSTLEADDIAALSTLYPAADFFSTTGTISGVIYASNGSTRLTGVNVIARNLADPFNDAVSAISSDFTDSTSQSDPFVGVYTINGLTPGADYAIYVDEILAGGFSTPPLSPLAGPEEFHNGADESNNLVTPDDPSAYTPVAVAAGSPTSGIDIIFNGVGPGDPLPLGDDDNYEVFLPFPYEICGQGFESVFVNSNGNLTFGSGSNDFSESVAEMLANQPRIAPLWDDLNPTQGGVIYYTYTDNTFTVHYENVPEFFATGANTFEVILHRASGVIDFVYGDITASDGLAGVSCGGAITSGFEPGTDLTYEMASQGPDGRINLQRQPAVYELFSPSTNPNDLSYEVLLFNTTTDYNDNWAENNDTLGKARRVKLPFDTIDVTRFSEIEPTGGDVDYYRFRATAGENIVAEVINGQLDTVIGLFDADGNLVTVDDDGGAGLLSKIVYQAPSSDFYTLAVTTFPDFDFSGDGNSGGRYVLDVYATNQTPLNLGDDDTVEVSLGFTFPYQGTDWTSVWVNSNGNLTFGSGNTDFSESIAEFLADQPRIAPLWDDLSPNNGGEVLVGFDSGSATISFVDVPEFVATGANTFHVTLRSDGSVTVVYETVTASDGLAGVTEGGGAADPGPTDLSAGTTYPVSGTTYELFTGGNAFDLSNTTLDYVP